MDLKVGGEDVAAHREGVLGASGPGVVVSPGGVESGSLKVLYCSLTPSEL